MSRKSILRIEPRRRPAIRTPRLTLRPFREADRGALHRLLEGREARAYFDTGGRRLTAARLAATLIRDANAIKHDRAPCRLSLAIVPRGRRQPVGGALLACDAVDGADVGLWLSPAFRRQGLGHETLCALLRHGFSSLDRHRISGYCDAGNRASIRLMESCGMRYQHQVKIEDEQGVEREQAYFALNENSLSLEPVCW